MVQRQFTFSKEFFRAAKSSLGAHLLRRLVANPIITCGWIMIGLTCGLIIANAVSLQSGPHPAPLFREPTAIVELSNEQLLDQEQELPKNPRQILVGDIQLALSQSGYYQGEIDGKTGPLTEQAIREFQVAHSFPVNLAVNEALLAQIIVSGSGFKVAKIDYMSENHISTLQEALANLGFGPVKIDGKLSRQTKEAIEKFELTRGLPVTGEPSDTLFNELKNVGGLSN